MERFETELETGEIHERDKWQFELKSDFFPLSKNERSVYTQEFYLFIPNSLQINETTYSKQGFYIDQTNFIRYKTPVFSLAELIDPDNSLSPLVRISGVINNLTNSKSVDLVEDELKLLGNIVRSALRRRISLISAGLEKEKPDIHKCNKEVHELDSDFALFREAFAKIESEVPKETLTLSLKKHFQYVNEFISNSVSFYLTSLLVTLRSLKLRDLKDSDRKICAILVNEEKIKERIVRETVSPRGNSHEKEFILYREGLLEKFVLDALLLKTSRTSPDQRLQNLIGAFAAGIAMLFYFVLFIWQGQVFVINSEPFIIMTVLLYVLKDRLKDSLKAISYRLAFKWFSDYTTEIKSPDGEESLGKLKEFFGFISPSSLPNDIVSVRNKEFHYVLEEFRRPESVIHYKKRIEMDQSLKSRLQRRHNLNIIFRFNILPFLTKADDAYQDYVTLDPKTLDFHSLRLPKVYHLNMIMKNTFLEDDGSLKTEIKKFRIILDKNGIKRIEHVV